MLIRVPWEWQKLPAEYSVLGFLLKGSNPSNRGGYVSPHLQNIADILSSPFHSAISFNHILAVAEHNLI